MLKGLLSKGKLPVKTLILQNCPGLPEEAIPGERIFIRCMFLPIFFTDWTTDFSVNNLISQRLVVRMFLDCKYNYFTKT